MNNTLKKTSIYADLFKVDFNICIFKSISHILTDKREYHLKIVYQAIF